MNQTRSCGVLLHLSSLPSPGGIGTMGQEAYDFVDFLKEAGQSWWQMLPLGCTGVGDSPYASCSTFAGNPYFIDPVLLQQEGLLTADELSAAGFGEPVGRVDYGALSQTRLPLLKRAFHRSTQTPAQQRFEAENADWLPDFCAFCALKEHFGGRSWQEWPAPLKRREPKALEPLLRQLAPAVRFYAWVQFTFDRQWRALQAYAHRQGVGIIGDLPIYVAADSADAWANPRLFVMDEALCPREVAGCPPDYFSEDGQLWGNPIYDWAYQKKTNYAWWTRRLQCAFSRFDKVRIDHFRGFAGYYCVPYGSETARHGVWRQGPGEALFAHFARELGELDILAEDLGLLTPDVRQLLSVCGFPGMKILQYAFDPYGESDYLPHRYERNCVAYPGTHDNDTLCGWLQSAPAEEVDFAREYLCLRKEEGEHWGMLRGLYASVADLAMVPMQDFLGLSSEARMNTPSTLGQNWQWRMGPKDASPALARKIRALAALYGRAPKPAKKPQKA